ncbi:MAG: hypothetical protein IPQ07_00730 [Myxococcales bacterium]|nr:hypothetical protein [Myxococcales bacterium]
MRTAILISTLAACGASQPAGTEPEPDATVAVAADAAVAPSYGERCGNAADDDGDGLADEDCAPRLFAGVFAPAVATDPALAALEGATQRPLAVLQTYHSLSAQGIARTAPDLAAIFARGQVAHLNVEPSGYAAPQYAAPALDPVAHDLTAMADAIAGALAAAPAGRVLLTFGAEMNGAWTDWGCLPAAQFIALYRAFHDRVHTALAARAIDPRRVRWAYGPNATSSASCGSAAGYYPGHAYVDLLGMSAYRAGTDTVATSVLAPMAQLFAALGYPAIWQRDRFVVLQTGTRAVAGDDRDAWITGLFHTLTTDPRVAGLIYFDAADWGVAPQGPGWAGLTTALEAAPVADRALDATFLPWFWDVAYSDPGFAEIQALRDAGVTMGCATAPARFCPEAPLDRTAALALLGGAFPGATLPAMAEPVTETALAAAITALGGTPPAAVELPATRARAAVLIARGAGLAPRPL